MAIKLVTGVLTPDEKEQNIIARDEFRFKSPLGVFKSTNGIRPGEFSTLLGQQGNGKSAFCKTISMNCATSNKKCYHLLSEEKSSIYKNTMANVFEIATQGKNPEKFLNNLIYDSMLEWDKDQLTVEFLFSHLEEVINEHAIEIIIFDNFTTSFLGSLPIGVQGDVIAMFRNMAAIYDIAILGVFHTEKGTDIYKTVLSGENVRGNATSTNGSGYVYVLSTFFRSSPPKAFISIDKARYHSGANKTVWELLYDKDIHVYVSDKKSSYEYIMETMQESNKKVKNFQKTPRYSRGENG